MPLDQHVAGRPWFVAGQTVPIDAQICPPELINELREEQRDDVATLFLTRWGSIRSHFWETTRGLRSVYNLRTSPSGSLEDLRSFLVRVAQRCTLPFRVNISVSSILRAKNPDSNGDQVLRFFHGSEQNGAVFEVPHVITQVSDLEEMSGIIATGQTPDVLDEESAAWSRVMITAVTLYIHHVVLGGPTGPDTQPKVCWLSFCLFSHALRVSLYLRIRSFHYSDTEDYQRV